MVALRTENSNLASKKQYWSRSKTASEAAYRYFSQENHIKGTELYYRLYHSVYLAHTEVDAPGVGRKYCSRQFSEVGQVAHGVSVKPTVASQFSSVYLASTLAFRSVETDNY